MDRDRVVVGLDGGRELHLARDRRRVHAAQLDLRAVVGGEEGERALLQHVVLRVVLDARVREVEEEGERKLRRRHAGELRRHLLRETEAKDTIHTLEVRAVAHGDAAELGEGVEVAELHDVRRLIALEVGVIRVLEEELAVLDVPNRLGLDRVKPGAVGPSLPRGPALVGIERADELVASGVLFRVAVLALRIGMHCHHSEHQVGHKEPCCACTHRPQHPAASDSQIVVMR
mmetsp:Transcript_3454/g.8251  ORF Transcript_3454/g.8251 Transcript_3454/m.8251 type:complete len:231 (+) Transcript_3454:1110-1802(+)